MFNSSLFGLIPLLVMIVGLLYAEVFRPIIIKRRYRKFAAKKLPAHLWNWDDYRLLKKYQKIIKAEESYKREQELLADQKGREEARKSWLRGERSC